MTGVSFGNGNSNTYFFVVLYSNVKHGLAGYICPSLGRNVLEVSMVYFITVYCSARFM